MFWQKFKEKAEFWEWKQQKFIIQLTNNQRYNNDMLLTKATPQSGPLLCRCEITYIETMLQQMFYYRIINKLTKILFWYLILSLLSEGPSWSWSYGSWIYNYLCNQYLSPLMLWVRISIRARCTTLCDKDCHWLVTGWWFFSRSSGFLHQSNWPSRYNWNIVESGVKHHKKKKQSCFTTESSTNLQRTIHWTL
jgi:hypothetical protein